MTIGNVNNGVAPKEEDPVVRWCRTCTATTTAWSAIASFSAVVAPPALVDLIFHFAVAENDFDPRLYSQNRSHTQQTNPDHGALPPAFTALASVSKEWHALADETASDRVLRRVALDVGSSSRKSLLESRRVLTLHRAHVRRLTVMSIPALHVQNPIEVWESVLSLTPKLQELSLEEACWPCPSSDLVAHVVGAAGRLPINTCCSTAIDLLPASKC